MLYKMSEEDKNIINNLFVFAFDEKFFQNFCKGLRVSDANVSNEDEYAFISISNYGNEDDHYFHSNHDNVLNQEFDDVDDSFTESFDANQAKEMIEFIKRNLGRNFVIHCKAGKSRSQGVCRYIIDTYPCMYSDNRTNKSNPCITPNWHVVTMLKRVYREMNENKEENNDIKTE